MVWLAGAAGASPCGAGIPLANGWVLLVALEASSSLDAAAPADGGAYASPKDDISKLFPEAVPSAADVLGCWSVSGGWIGADSYGRVGGLDTLSSP